MNMIKCLRWIPAVSELERKYANACNDREDIRTSCDLDISRKASDIARLRAEVDLLERELKKKHAQLELRAVAWPKPAHRLTEKQIIEHLGADPSAEPMNAIHQLLDDTISDYLDLVTQPPSATNNEQNRLHLAGGAEALRNLQAKLMGLHKRAARGEEEEEEDKE